MTLNQAKAAGITLVRKEHWKFGVALQINHAGGTLLPPGKYRLWRNEGWASCGYRDEAVFDHEKEGWIRVYPNGEW